MQPLLLGEHPLIVDDKKRIKIPTRFRERFADGVVLTRGLEPCVAAYPLADWRSMRERLERLDPLSAEARRLRRYFYSGARLAIPDSQGRITLPVKLLEEVRIHKFVVLAGVSDHLEIWDDAAWKSELRRTTEIESPP
jgi:MraZ protein